MATPNSESIDELLSAYLDGEVTAAEETHIEHLLQHDEKAQQRLVELRRTVHAVASLPRHTAPPNIVDDVMLYAERSELLGGTAPRPRALVGRRLFVPAMISMAAVLGLAVGVTWIMFGEEGQPARLFDHVDAPSPSLRAAKSSRGRASDAESLDRTARSALPTGKTTALLARANLEQKLEAGLGPESVRDHAFSNEPLYLQIPVRTPAEGREATDQLVSMLAAQHTVNLGDDLGSEREESQPPGSFFYRGRVNVNFSDTDEQQVLVRARRQDLLNVVNKVVELTPEPQRVAFHAGPITVRGAAQVESALGGVATRPLASLAEATPDEQETQGRGPARIQGDTQVEPTDPEQDFGEALDHLIASLGLDPNGFKALPSPAGAPGPSSDETLALGLPADRRATDSDTEGAAGHKEDRRTRAVESPRASGAENAAGAAASSSRREQDGVARRPVSFTSRNRAEERAEPAGPATAASERRARSPRATAKRPSVGPPERSSLVDRRLSELKRARNRVSDTSVMQPLEAPTEPNAQSPERALDPFVTLVIQLIPTPPRPTATPEPPASHRTQPQPSREGSQSSRFR